MGKIPAYLEHFESVGLPIARRYMYLAGFWTVEVGEINEIYHWQKDFMPKALELIVAQRSVFLKPTVFSPEFNSGLTDST